MFRAQGRCLGCRIDANMSRLAEENARRSSLDDASSCSPMMSTTTMLAFKQLPRNPDVKEIHRPLSARCPEVCAAEPCSVLQTVERATSISLSMGEQQQQQQQGTMIPDGSRYVCMAP